nr:LamG domain-containing protein [Bacillus infantis]
MTIANSPSLHFNREMTVSYWLRMDSHRGEEGNYQSTIPQGIHAIFGKQNDHSGDLFSYLTTDNGKVNLGVGGQGSNVNGVFAVGEWVHVTQVLSSNSLKMYINGSKLVDTTLAQPFDFSVANTKNLTIGRLGNGWYPLYGTLDDFRMYNTALSDNQIQALYQLGEN